VTDQANPPSSIADLASPAPSSGRQATGRLLIIASTIVLLAVVGAQMLQTFADRGLKFDNWRPSLYTF